MPTDMPLGLPFAVDKWGPSSRNRRHRFLTHAHKDHLVDASAGGGGTVYATRLTWTLALRHFPQLESWELVEMEVGRTMEVDDPTGAFSVTAYDANHCPGAVMFLFEGQFGTILHTGDCRLTSDCVQNLPMKYIVKKGNGNVCRLDFVFLDCTFSKCFLELPSKESAIQQVIECIWKHPHAPFVYLACDLLGHEDILVEVSRTFGLKIYVDRKLGCFKVLSLTAPEIITDDPSSRFQMVGFHQFYDKASRKLEEARASLEPEPLFIRPSTQWYANRAGSQKPRLTEAEQDEFGIWHICFSIHSSRDELEQALQLLQPQWVISTTPPLLATELNYVKRKQYCFRRNGVDISLSHALGMRIFFRVQIFLDGIPEHARTPDIVERVIGVKCVLQCINTDLGQHLDTRHIELWAWAPDPRDIPRRVWLIFTHQPSDESSYVVVSPPERWRQGLRYEVLIHIATLEDYSEASYNLDEAMARPDSYRPVRRMYTWRYGVVDGRLPLPPQERTARPGHAADARHGRDRPNLACHERDRAEDDGRWRSNWSGCKDGFGWPPHHGEDDEDDYEHPGRGGHQRQHDHGYRRERSRSIRRRPLANGYYGGYRRATLEQLAELQSMFCTQAFALRKEFQVLMNDKVHDLTGDAPLTMRDCRSCRKKGTGCYVERGTTSSRPATLRTVSVSPKPETLPGSVVQLGERASCVPVAQAFSRLKMAVGATAASTAAAPYVDDVARALDNMALFDMLAVRHSAPFDSTTTTTLTA